MFKIKITFSILMLVCILFVYVSKSLAANTTTTTSPTITQSAELQPITKETYNASKQTSFTLINLVNALGCLGEDYSFTRQGCVGYTLTADSIPQLRSYNHNPSGGVLGVVSNSIAFMYVNPPASGIQYLAYTLENFGVAKPAYAQVVGSGAAVIEPVRALWRAMANIAYIALTIVLVVIGFMIMIRRQLDQRTVVSLQQALPGIVLALVLIYFSFFIAGIIIDIAFVATRIIGVAIVSALTIGRATPFDSNGFITRIVNEQNVFGIFTQFISLGGSLGGAANEIGGTVTSLLNNGSIRAGTTLSAIIAMLGTCLSLRHPAAILGCLGATGVVPNVAPGLIINPLIYVVLLIALLTAMIRLFFSLISNFVSIVLNVIFAPFIILTSALPGNGGAVMNWMKGLLANVLAFPAVFAIFTLVAAILNFGNPWPFDNPRVIEPNLFTPLPLFGGLSTVFIQAILAYGLLLATPAIPDYIKKQLKVDEPAGPAKETTTNIGTGIGTVKSTIGGVIKAFR